MTHAMTAQLTHSLEARGGLEAHSHKCRPFRQKMTHSFRASFPETQRARVSEIRGAAAAAQEETSEHKW
jgi:hypothetical protein